MPNTSLQQVGKYGVLQPASQVNRCFRTCNEVSAGARVYVFREIKRATISGAYLIREFPDVLLGLTRQSEAYPIYGVRWRLP